MREVARGLWSVVSFFLTLPWLLPLALVARGPGRPWVFGGHRGRLRLDNAAALQDHLLAQTTQPSVWVSSSPAVLAACRARGIPALRRGGLRARWAILTAPVLVFSHGDDDLDPLFILLRRVAGFRVYVNHSMNLLKAGEAMLPVFETARGLRRAVLAWAQTDFDVCLATSEPEARNFERSYPHKRGAIVPGGGAHLDAVLRGRTGAREPVVFWFPTFREDAAGRAALARERAGLAASAPLAAWLRETGRRLVVGGHVNAVGGAPGAGPLEAAGPERAGELLLSCEIFVSDYSGLLFDALALDKPILYFPFDRDEYLRRRRLYTDYDDIVCGPVARSAAELVGILVSGRWRVSDEDRARADRWRRRIFPSVEPVYAAAGYAAILREVRRRRPRLAPPWRAPRVPAAPGD